MFLAQCLQRMAFSEFICRKLLLNRFRIPTTVNGTVLRGSWCWSTLRYTAKQSSKVSRGCLRIIPATIATVFGEIPNFPVISYYKFQAIRFETLSLKL